MKTNAHFSDLKDKVVLITGSSRGIGREIAKNLAKQNACLVLNYRSSIKEMEDFKEELVSIGASGVHLLNFDLLNLGKAKEAIDQFCKEVKPIEALVNNAGVSKDSLILRNKVEDTKQTLDINLTAPIALMSYLSRYFLKVESASVVNVSSIVGLMGNPSQTNYSASKAGLIGATKSFAKELASKNVRCNAICPGFIETEMTEKLSKEAKMKYYESIPLKRFGKTSEVAELVSFLLSQSSSYITGEVFKIDGGLYI
jgi:3-oxoacyl-[acyl-carrier protein] reductase